MMPKHLAWERQLQYDAEQITTTAIIFIIIFIYYLRRCPNVGESNENKTRCTRTPPVEMSTRR